MSLETISHVLHGDCIPVACANVSIKVTVDSISQIKLEQFSDDFCSQGSSVFNSTFEGETVINGRWALRSFQVDDRPNASVAVKFFGSLGSDFELEMVVNGVTSCHRLCSRSCWLNELNRVVIRGSQTLSMFKDTNCQTAGVAHVTNSTNLVKSSQIRSGLQTKSFKLTG